MMKSILYVRLPCHPIYPGGVIQLASYIHRHRAQTKQRILDLALIEKGERKKILTETIKDISPDIIAFSLRDTRSAHIQGLFARMAKDYDRLNSFISLGLCAALRRAST